MTAEQSSADRVLELLGQARSELDGALAAAQRGQFRASDLERLLAIEEGLKGLRSRASELSEATVTTVRRIAELTHEKTGRWPVLPDGRQVQCDQDSPRHSFRSAQAAQAFLDEVITTLTDLAPATDAVEWTARRLAELYPLGTKSVRLSEAGLAALGIDAGPYRSAPVPGRRDYKLVHPKIKK